MAAVAHFLTQQPEAAYVEAQPPPCTAPSPLTPLGTSEPQLEQPRDPFFGIAAPNINLVSVATKNNTIGTRP
jgi:hypothetical protein